MRTSLKYSLCASFLLSLGILTVPSVAHASDSIVNASLTVENNKEQATVNNVLSDEPQSSKTESINQVEENDSRISNQEMTPTQITTQPEAQATVQDQVNNNPVNETSVDGVFTVGDQNAQLTDQNGNVGTRSLAANTGWYTDKLTTSQNGDSYYRVSTLEYVNASAGSFTSNIQDYDATATLAYKKGASVHTFTGYGNNAVYTGTNQNTGTAWKVSQRANQNGKYWYEIGNNVWVPQDYVVVSDAPDMKTANWISGVPLISQRPELPNGCEITAVTMMLQYAGAKVDKMQLAREMPRSSNPEYGYIGQPWDSTGITIFPNALMSLVEKYAGSAKDLSGMDFNAIKYQIDLGHPVVTWNTLHGFPYHALTVTGYDSQYVYYNDCWTNQTTQMGIDQFISNWNTQNRRAISY